MELISLDEVDRLIQILESILSPTSECRQQREIEVTHLKETRPNELACAFLKILEFPSSAPVKTLVCVLLRQYLSHYSPACIWPRLAQPVQESLKSQLLERARSEPDLTVRRRVCEVVSVLAITAAHRSPEQPWPELMEFLMSSLLSVDELQLVAGLYTLAGLCPHFHEQLLLEKDTLLEVFLHNLNSPWPRV